MPVACEAAAFSSLSPLIPWPGAVGALQKESGLSTAPQPLRVLVWRARWWVLRLADLHGAVFGGLASSAGCYTPGASSMPGRCLRSWRAASFRDVVGGRGGQALAPMAATWVRPLSCGNPVVVAIFVRLCHRGVDGFTWTLRLHLGGSAGSRHLEQKVC